MSMARIYLATSWKNEEQPKIVDLLKTANHQVYDFRTSGFRWDDVGLERPCTAFMYRDTLLSHPRVAQGFLTDFAAMRWANVGLLLLPAGRSAHLELGWMAGAGKRTLILTKNGEEPELMALLADKICINMSEVMHELRLS